MPCIAVYEYLYVHLSGLLQHVIVHSRQSMFSRRSCRCAGLPSALACQTPCAADEAGSHQQQAARGLREDTHGEEWAHSCASVQVHVRSRLHLAVFIVTLHNNYVRLLPHV